MTRVAISSIRLTNPEATIMIACDEETASILAKSADPILQDADQWLTVSTPPGSNTFRNRFVKTTLRKHLSGPFLFLDSDIVVRGDLSRIFKSSADIAGAPNHSRTTLQEQIWEKDQEMLTAMGWPVNENVYINGGVLFYNDTPKAYQFAEAWHQKWLSCSQRLQSYRDQPALNAAVHEIKPQMAILEYAFNAQIETNVRSAWGAVIWHFYAAAHEGVETNYEVYIKKIQGGTLVEEMAVRQLIVSPHPWRKEFLLDDLIILRIKTRNDRSTFDHTWLQGKRWLAITNKVMDMQEKIIAHLKKLLSLLNV